MSAQPPYRPPTTPPPGYGGYRRNNRPLLITAAVVALVVIGAVGYWLGGRDASSTPNAQTTPASSALPSSASSASAAASGVAASSAAAASSSASSASSASGGPSTSADASSSAPTTTTSPTPTTTTASHPVPDFGYVRTVTTSGGGTRLTFDRATLLTGAAAASAAKAHGQTVEDDYFIVNDNPLIRTFSVSPTVSVVGSQNLVGEVGPKPSTLAALEAWLAAHKGQTLPVDLAYDAKGTTVTKITEMFFP